MPLTPEEQAELNQLQQELAPKTQGGLTPEEQAELQSLQAELSPKQSAPQAPAIGEGEAFARGAAQSGTLGFADEIQGLGKSAYDYARGTLAVPNKTATGDIPGRLGDTPGIAENYRGNREEARAGYTTAEKSHPNYYLAGELAGGAATSALPGGLIAQGALQGLGSSRSDLTQGDVSEVAKDAAVGGAAGAFFTGVGKLAGKAGSAIADSKYGRAFSGGGEVGKFGSEGPQSDLANKVSKAIEEKVTAARIKQMEARASYLDQVGDKTLDTSDIVKKSYESSNRAGPGVMGADGKVLSAMAPKERAMLDNYTATIAEPKSAQELYSVWDDLKRETDYNDALGASSEFNNQLKLLQGGIKEKLHSLGAGLPEADRAYSAFSDQAAHLKRGVNETSNESFLSTLGNKNRGNRQEAFQEVLSDKPDILKEVNNFQTSKAFEGQGGFGSDYGLGNAAGILAGGAAGYALGGDGSSSTMGSLAGAVLSKGRNQRAILTHAGDATEAIMSKLPSLPPQYTQALTEAAKRGGNALAITHFLLGQKDPTYQAATKKDDQ